jgi:hypothetical protein
LPWDTQAAGDVFKPPRRIRTKGPSVGTSAVEHNGFFCSVEARSFPSAGGRAPPSAVFPCPAPARASGVNPVGFAALEHLKLIGGFYPMRERLPITPGCARSRQRNCRPDRPVLRGLRNPILTVHNPQAGAIVEIKARSKPGGERCAGDRRWNTTTKGDC